MFPYIHTHNTRIHNYMCTMVHTHTQMHAYLGRLLTCLHMSTYATIRTNGMKYPGGHIQGEISYTFIHLFILAISIAPLQVLYHSEALPTTARILYRSFTPKRTGNCR